MRRNRLTFFSLFFVLGVIWQSPAHADPPALLNLHDYIVLTQKDAHVANEAGDEFGKALAAGDFNNDGFMDLAVGGPGEAPGNDPQSGTVFLFQGSGGGPTKGKYQYRTQKDGGGGNESGDNFGFSLATGDFNGDGFDDLAVGNPEEAPGDDPKSGAVHIFPGSSDGITTGQYVTQKDAGGANESGDNFGFSLAAGNFNGDSYDDLAIGTPKEAPGNDPTSGAVFIFTGSGAGIHSGQFITQEDADGKNEQDDQFGWALATGDLNGDGRDELVVGAPGEAPTSDPKSGAIFVFEDSGNEDYLGRYYTQISMGGVNETYDQFGRALTLGDFNAYGADDLVIGAPGERPSADPKSGAVFFIAGLPSAPVLTHGGLIGAVTDTQVKIWARANRAAELVVQYRKPLSSWKISSSVNLKNGKDFTGVVQLGNLTPNQTYDYRILLNGVEVSGSQSTFKTLKPIGSPGTLRFAIGADMDFRYAPFSIFDKIAQRNPDFMILMGDQIYETPKGLMPNKKTAHERKYKENWAEKYLRTFMKVHSTFVTWDDHELINNWDEGKTGRYLSARPAYDEYQGKHNPSPRTINEIYYSFSAGEIEFYVLDTRSFRSPNNNVDNDSKSMLGAIQKADLKKWLSASTGKFKFIVSSVPWHDYGFTGNDSWKGFKTERSEIFNYIKDNAVRGVLLLSGDQHATAILRLSEVTPYFLYEFSPTPLAHNPFTLAVDNAQVLYKDKSSRVYGFFQVDTTIDPAMLQFDVYNSNNTSLYHLEISENDISPPPDLP